MSEDRWTLLVDDAAHEINMRWACGDPDDLEPMDQALVRETAEAILRPLEDEYERLWNAIQDALATWGLDAQIKLADALRARDGSREGSQ
jgi:hypothetical protein